MEEVAKSLLTSYEPLDISSIKPSKIRSEKELDAEANVICEILKDVKGDWNQRLKALLQVQSFIVSDDVKSLNNFPSFILRLVAPLTMQLQDLRSQITKEASKAISLMAQVLQQDFEPLAHRFISKNSLYKLLNAAKHILAEHSHICIIAILNNVVCPKQHLLICNQIANRVISNIYEEVKSKNPGVRIKNAEYLYLILTLYPEDSFSNYITQIDDLLSNLLQDAKSEARQIARMAFYRYKQLFPERANSIYQRVDTQNQRAILDDEELQGFDIPNQQMRLTDGWKQKSPTKTLKMTSAVQEFDNNSLNPISVKAQSMKQTRSVSRGRPNTTSNNLIQKASIISPDQMKPIKVHRLQEEKKDEDLELVLCEDSPFGKDQSYQQVFGCPDPKEGSSPKLDLSKLRLLKSPRTSKQPSLKVQTNLVSLNQPHLAPESAKQPEKRHNFLQLESQQSTDSKNGPSHGEIKLGNLCSPKLPPEKQQQLKNLKEKKLKQIDELSIPANNLSTRQSIKTLQPIDKKSQSNAAGNLVSPLFRKGEKKPLNQNKALEEKLKRQKSASPRQSSPPSSIAKDTKKAKQPQQQFQTLQQNSIHIKSDKPHHIGNKEDAANYQTSNTVQKQYPQELQTQKQKQSLKMQVSHSIHNIQKIQKNQKDKQEEMSQQIQNQLDSSDEQKIYDELDFLQQNDSIESLIVSCQSQNQGERLRSFQMIKKCEDQLQECSDQLIKKLFEVHLDYLNDANQKIIIAVQESLSNLIQYKRQLLDKYLDQVVPIVLFNMVSQFEQVSISSSDLINLICLYSKTSDLVLILMDILKEHTKNLKVITAALEVLVVLLKDDLEYCAKNANVLETCLKIVELLETNHTNMDVIMPSIAVLLAMRDKNLEGTMKAMVFLKQNQLALLIKLSNQFAPDFEMDIRRHVKNDPLVNSKMNSSNSSISSSSKNEIQQQKKSIDAVQNIKGPQRQSLKQPQENRKFIIDNTQEHAYSGILKQDSKSSITQNRNSQIQSDMDFEQTPTDKKSQSMQMQLLNKSGDISFDLLQKTPNLQDFADIDFTQQQEPMKMEMEKKEITSPRRIGRVQSDPYLSPSKKILGESSNNEVDEEDANFAVNEDDAVVESIENFNDLIFSTQISQKNYIMSKAGDTVEDQMDDGVTPTPIKKLVHQASSEGASKGFSFQDEDTEHEQLRVIIEESSEENRAGFLRKVQELLDKNFVSTIDRNFAAIVNLILEILQEEQEMSLKELCLHILKEVIQMIPRLFDESLQDILQELAIAFQANKKMVSNFETLLIVMNDNLDRVQLFQQLDEYMKNHDHNQLQAFIKMASFLLRQQTKENIDECFSILFDNFYQLMSHSQANVRKSLVFAMVDAYFIMDKESYEKYLSRFNVNQQKLITIYIERKSNSSNNE